MLIETIIAISLLCDSSDNLIAKDICVKSYMRCVIDKTAISKGITAKAKETNAIVKCTLTEGE